MALILKGAPAAAALDNETLKAVHLLKIRGITPTLGILHVGDRPDDMAYEAAAVRRCEKLGIETKLVSLPADVKQGALMAQIARLNSNERIHGVLMFRPLPSHLDERAACAALMPCKDVDGITPESASMLYTGSGGGFAPCTAEAVIALLEHYGIGLDGKNAVVVGRSLVIGRPVSMLLLARNATVTVCHSRTRGLPELTRRADIVVTALGKAESLTADCFMPGQIVVDVGINYSKEKQRLVGDVHFEAVEPIVGAVSPVPAGVGAVTTAILAKHVAAAAGGMT